MFECQLSSQKIQPSQPYAINTTTPTPLLEQKDDVGQIRTDAPEGTRFLVLRDNHSATTPPFYWLDEETESFNIDIAGESIDREHQRISYNTVGPLQSTEYAGS